ncbi:MAG: glutathione-disulfide reductase [Proteobacteria bacterium]|mgnify:CR=1 FL=1|nr:glutathione-disulfide reductase [Pseudomonadota bacterium]
MSSKFDLVVIGGGSGGVACARRAAEYNAKVAIIESHRFGGTCVIRGCIPKKLMMYAGDIGNTAFHAGDFGWIGLEPAKISHEIGTWTSKKNIEISRLEKIYEDLLKTSGVELIKGSAVVVNKNEVKVGDRHYLSKNLVIAVGGTPNLNQINGLENALTSDGILDLDETPGRVGILGSGYIATEFASILNNLGIEVSLLFRADMPLKGFDKDIRIRLMNHMVDSGINVHPACKFHAIEKTPEGTKVRLTDRTFHFDTVLNALGRSPNTKGLFVPGQSPAIGSKGQIIVDENNKSSIPEVFAIGDVTDRINLTPVAIAEGRAVAENLFNKNSLKVDYNQIASAVFTSPPIGTIGLTEEAVKKSKNTHRIYESEFNPLKKSFTSKKTKAFYKLIVEDKSDKLVGAHIFGDDAPEIIQTLAIAFKAGAKKSHLDDTMAVHPTGAEELVLMRKPSRII